LESKRFAYDFSFRTVVGGIVVGGREGSEEEAFWEASEGFLVTSEDVVGGVPVVECEADCDGFLVGDVAHEDGTG